MAVSGTIKRLALFNFLTDCDLLAPLAILYYVYITHSYTAATSIFAITMISQAIFEIPTGVYSDMIGRKKTIVVGTLALLLGAAVTAVSQSFGMLAAAAALIGLSRSFFSGNNDAYLHDVLRINNQAEAYDDFLGKTSSLFQVGAAVSALLSGIIAMASFRLLAWVSVAIKLVQLVVALGFEAVPHDRQSGNVFAHLGEAFKLFITNKRLRLLSLGSIIGYALSEPAFQFRAAFVQTLWPLWAIGITRFLSNVGAAASYYFSGKILKQISAVKILVIDNLYSKVINILSLAIPTILSPLLMTSTSLLYGVSEVAESTLMQKEFSVKQRATMGSFNSLGGSILFGGVSISLGLLADKLSPAKGLLVLQLVSFIVVAINFKLLAMVKEEQPTT